MTLLQLGIGATNDVVDAPRDAGRKAGKPIPAGLVAIRSAATLAIGCFVTGLALASTTSAAAGPLALLVIAIGLAYDLRLKGTAWSWLPFAVGIPILPVFGWAAVGRALPAAFLVLVPAAVAAGAALAIANALVDVERDRAAAVSSVAIALGSDRASRLAIGLLAVIWVAAVGSSVNAGVATGPVVGIALAGVVPVVAAAAEARVASAAARERAWQAQAGGLAVLAAAWLTAILGASAAG
jgi:4-hydroxybenzoate polyprenyltransferase